ncbi:MAG: protein-glutamate O-methyltransferase CheR [Oligoflexia bacterium]|nr:protein-glutamate O-methyltransferase CheR [Oligoflexia bacterium]
MNTNTNANRTNILECNNYESVKELIYTHLGISISEKDQEEFFHKLKPVMSAYNCKTLDELFQLLLEDPNNEILGEIANKITTNYSYFNRETNHFDFLRSKVLPELVAELRKKSTFKLSIWSAACSTGEEPYTLGILLREFLGAYYDNWIVSVLGTDISSKVLKEAKNAIYPLERVEGMPADLFLKYFDRVDPQTVKVKDEYKKDVGFRVLNLKHNGYQFREGFNAVFCRNVFIYFDEKMIDHVAMNVHRCLDKGGYFFIGVSETLGKRNTNYFEFIAPGIYRKK